MADLNISKIINNKTPVEFNFTEGGTLTGNRKLAQMWIKLFLTEAGSNIYYPTVGTNFLADLRNSRITNAAQVTTAFKIAADTINTTLVSDPTYNELPGTEQLSEAILDNFDIDTLKSILKLYVTLIPVEGDPVNFEVPVYTKG